MTVPMASLELILRLCSRRCQVLLHKRRQVLEVPLPTVLLSLKTSCQQLSVITTTTDLFPIIVNVEGGEAVDAVAAAQFSVRVAVGCAVHVADSHLGVVCGGCEISDTTFYFSFVFSIPLYFSASFSQVGANRLQ